MKREREREREGGGGRKRINLVTLLKFSIVSPFHGNPTVGGTGFILSLFFFIYIPSRLSSYPLSPAFPPTLFLPPSLPPRQPAREMGFTSVFITFKISPLKPRPFIYTVRTRHQLDIGQKCFLYNTIHFLLFPNECVQCFYI